jgi:hypothetical protein
MHTGQLALTIEYIFSSACALLAQGLPTRHQVSVVPCCLLLPADPQEAGEGLLFLARQAAHLMQTPTHSTALALNGKHCSSNGHATAIPAQAVPGQGKRSIMSTCNTPPPNKTTAELHYR